MTLSVSSIGTLLHAVYIIGRLAGDIRCHGSLGIKFYWLKLAAG